MDGTSQKKWFVYLSDHHEGPFALSEIESLMRQGTVTQRSYVWCQGMTDWKVMSDVDAFQSLNRATEPAPVVAAPITETVSATVEVAAVSVEIAPVVMEAPAPEPEPAPKPAPKKKEISPRDERPVEKKLAEKKKTAPQEKPPAKKGWIAAAAVILLLGAGTSAYFYFYPSAAQVLSQQLSSLPLPSAEGVKLHAQEWVEPKLITLAEKYPALTKWISPIPRLMDVMPQDYEELRNAAAEPLQNGPRIAAALSYESPGTPTFYVASNLPDGAQIELFVEGVSDTLLNQLGFSAQSKSVIQKRIGKSNPLQFSDGRQIPKGDYVAYVYESTQQPAEIAAAISAIPVTQRPNVPASLATKKLLIKKSVFLGGAKDSTYEARLKEFHEKIKQKAQTELGELKQFQSTLSMVFKETVTQFDAARKPKLAKLRAKTWSGYQSKWAPMEQQIQQSFAQWTPQVLETQFYYSKSYSMLLETARSILKLHELQSRYFTVGPKEEAAFFMQLSSETAQVQSNLTQLVARIDQIEKTPLSPRGLPKREGL